MYSLFVSGQVKDRSEGAFDIESARFLEYTSKLILDQLESLSVEAMDCIKSWPCILMQEGRGQEEAFVGKITAIEIANAKIKLTFSPLSSESTVHNEALWKIRADLDIEQFEFNRNHLAIKDRDLFSTIATAGHSFDDSVISRFENKPLPMPPRSALIRARDAISELSHTEIDDFLLEAGVSGLAAGRPIGSRRDRANAIIEFALENPTTTTAENYLFSSYLVMKVGAPTNNLESRSELSSGNETAVDLQPGQNEGVSSTRSPNRVFVVHGQNDQVRSTIVSFLSRVGLEGIVLHEQANMGRHLLTKFIEEAELATFAIVLMTDDDIGGRHDSNLAPRARQNVILELGYFLSHLGQARVCALITPGLETPSDFDGIVYISMSDDGQWETELRRELLAAGMPVVEEPENTGAA